jgi:NitT/TauT family transport system permease protein
MSVDSTSFLASDARVTPSTHRSPPVAIRFGIHRFSWLAPAFRKLILLLAMAAVWELYARWLGKPLVLPTFTKTMAALVDGLVHGELAGRIATSMRVLLTGYVIGLIAAALLTTFAAGTRIGADLLELLTSMLNPLPAIALLPVALIWFGLGTPSIVFVTVHAVLWPVALNGYSGFKGVSGTLRMVGQNYGLSHTRFVAQILVPAAFPSILTGLKTGWAFAWRTLIAAELVFGVSASSGGVGWYIYENKNQLDIPSVFAGLCTVVIIGLLVEAGVFGVIERLTVRRWGMTSR